MSYQLVIAEKSTLKRAWKKTPIGCDALLVKRTSLGVWDNSLSRQATQMDVYLHCLRCAYSVFGNARNQRKIDVEEKEMVYNARDM